MSALSRHVMIIIITTTIIQSFYSLSDRGDDDNDVDGDDVEE